MKAFRGGGENSDMHETCTKTWFIRLAENSPAQTGNVQDECDADKWERVQKSWDALGRLKFQQSSFQP